MECILVFISFGEGEPSAGGGGGGAGSSRALAGWRWRSGPGEALTPSVVSFLPLRPIHQNPQGCHRMPHLGPYLPVPKHLPTQARAGHDKVGPAMVPGIFPSCPHSSFLLRNSVCLPLSSTRVPSLSLSLSLSRSSSLPSLSFNLPQKENHFQGGGLLSCLHLCCCRFES